LAAGGDRARLTGVSPKRRVRDGGRGGGCTKLHFTRGRAAPWNTLAVLHKTRAERKNAAQQVCVMIHCQMCARWSGSTQSNTATRLIAHALASASRNRRFFAKHCLLARRWTSMATLLRPAEGRDPLGRDVLPPAWAAVTGLEWVRDAERCWCGASCPLRRRHTCRPR
jgi:hypothetical protein